MTLNQLFAEMIQQTKGSEEDFLCRILIKALKEEMQHNWQQNTREKINLEIDLSDCVGCQEFWRFVKDVFMRRACKLASIENDPVYGEATKVAEIFRMIFARETGQSFSEVRIMSPSEMIAEAGPL